MKKNKVYISAFSSVSALGINNNEALNSLRSHKLNYRIHSDKYPYPVFTIDDLIKDYQFDEEQLIKNSKIALILLKNIEDSFINKGDIPLFISTSTGGIKETEDIYKELNNINYPLFEWHFFNKIGISIKEKYPNIFKESFTFSTACSSSGHSIAQAFNLIQNGIINRAIVIGVDVLCWTTLVGFDSLKLASHTLTKPLSNKRDGLTLGEGGGVLLLESEPEDTPIAEIISIYSNSDGYHISSPDPDGRYQSECIEKNIKESGINIDDIRYINAHGTGTVMNDEIEIKAIKTIFKNNPIVTSLKGFVGHTLGASAILELSLTLLMLREKRIFQIPDFSDPIDNNLVPEKSVNISDIEYFLKNSFGFGGNNVSIIVKR